MEKNHFLLETRENSRVTKVFQIIFGILCIGIAFFWAVFNFNALKADTRLWITIIFLVGFGTYQIAAGLGKITRYIETGEGKIILKQNSFLPKIELNSFDIEKIELFPLSIVFFVVNKKKFILRFGLNYTEIIEQVKEAVTEFAKMNGITIETKKEEI